MGFLDFAKYLFNDIPIDYQGPTEGWHVVPNYSQFTYSSVAGDFRLYPVPNGFVAAWGDFLSARDLAGQPLWRREGTGTVVAPSPDQRQLISYSNDSNELLRLNARTGEVLETFGLPDHDAYPNQLLWLPDGRLLVLHLSRLAVLAPDRSRYLAQYDTFAPMPEFGVSLEGMAWFSARPDEVLLADNSGCRMLRVALSTGKVLQESALEYPSLLPGPLGQQALARLNNEFVRLDPATLAAGRRYALVGLEGVRTEAENQHQNSCTMWEKRALLSPGDKYLLVIDPSGLTWLFDAKSGYQLRIFRRELVDYAYDVLWLDDRFFLALCNRGHVVKIDITQKDGVFDVTDFSPADDARHLPQGAGADTMRTEASAPEAVLAALNTLATTTDAAEYGAVWTVVHYAPADFEWAAVLTPAHLAGALRRYVWYEPATGFAAGLAAFAAVRQQLTALHYHLPEAPAAAVLALHDDVLARHAYKTLETEHITEEIEWQLVRAYNELGYWLAEYVTANEDDLTAAQQDLYEPYLAAVAEADAFVTALDGDYSWEAHNVLEQAFAAGLAADYERLVTGHDPAAQRRMLAPVQYHDHPAAVALLQRLAQGSPHAEVRAFAAASLADAGR